MIHTVEGAEVVEAGSRSHFDVSSGGDGGARSSRRTKTTESGGHDGGCGII